MQNPGRVSIQNTKKQLYFPKQLYFIIQNTSELNHKNFSSNSKKDLKNYCLREDLTAPKFINVLI